MHIRLAVNGVGFITRNEREQTDAALVRRFRQVVAKRDRAAMFHGVVREYRDAVLGRCAEQLWPDADAAVAAARDVFVVAYLAMADPAELTRPDRLRDWLLGIAAHGELASGRLPAGVDAVNWGALQASIAADAGRDARGSAAGRASLRQWVERIVATLPQPRQEMYDLFVRRALDSRNAALELGTDVAEARRLRRENREAILRAFEVTALAATPGCVNLLQLLGDAQRNGGMPEDVRREGVVLPADLRLGVTRHVADCDACRDRRDDCVARWASELVPILAGAELNEQVIEDLRTIPGPARSHAGAPAGVRLRGRRGAHRGTAPARADKVVNARRAGMAGAGLLAVLLVLGFVQPGFLLSTAASVPPSASSASSKDLGSVSLSSGSPQMIGSAQASGRPAPSAAAKASLRGLPPIPGVTAPTLSFAAPTLPVPGTVQPSSSPTSPSAQPTTAPSPSSSSSAPSPSPSPSASATPTSSPSPTTPPPTTPAPTQTPSPTPSPTTSASSTPSASSPVPSTSSALSPVQSSTSTPTPASSPALSASPAS